MIALAIGMPMMAQIVLNNDLKKVVGQYPGKIKVAAYVSEELKNDPWKPATGTIEQGSSPNKFNITIGGFKLGTRIFRKVVIKDVEALPLGKGITFYAKDYIKSTAEIEDANTHKVTKEDIQISPGTKCDVVNKQLSADLTFLYNELTVIYAKFETESKTATGIAGLHADTNKAQTIYDLSGRAVSKTRKGICIIDGKKVVVR